MRLSVLQSWLFWKDRYNEKPDAFHGYHFPDTFEVWNDALGHADCPFCNTYKVFHVKWKQWDMDMMCLCSLLEWIKDNSRVLRDYETPVQPADIDQLIPTNNVKNIPPGAAKDLQLLKDYIKGWYNNPNSWVTISGEPGSGKTHVLRSIKTKFPGMSMFVDAANFQQHLFTARTEPTGVRDLIRELSIVPILLFDDLGLEHENQWTLNVIAAVMNNRYKFWNEQVTVTSTNHSLDALVGSPNIAMKRIADRLVDGQSSRCFVLRQRNFRETRQPVKAVEE
jgi:DNA replication protein DnaC